MKKFKKTMSVLAVALIAALGIGGANVGATSWAVSHANYSGAPSSEGVAKSIIVKQRAKAATATCNYSTHTNSKATTGYTYIRCENYTMTKKTITNTGKATCNPSVGSPIANISVQYKVSAYTPTTNDTYNSQGNIVAIN